MTGGRGRPKARPAKRENGSGSITWDASKQRWRVELTVGRTADGRQIRKKRLIVDREEAEQVRLDMLRQYRGAEITGATPTLAQHAEDWLKLVNARRAPSTRTVVESDVRKHIIGGQLGHLVIDRLTYRHVEIWLADMRDQGFTHWTITTKKRTLSQILRWGVKRGLIGANPVQFAEMPANIRAGETKRAFTLDEASRFIAACQASEHPTGVYFLTTMMLGLRPGETSGLRWSSVRWATGTLHVDRALKREATGRPIEIGPTKTRHTRTVAMPPEVVDALSMFQVRHEVAVMTGPEMPARWADLIFIALDDGRENFGSPEYPTFLRKHLDELTAAADVPRLTPYELRHSCASILLARGVSPTTVADMLGTSERMLREHYHHLIDPTITAGRETWATITSQTDG